jgi:hypothetical protein
MIICSDEYVNAIDLLGILGIVMLRVFKDREQWV